MVEELLVSRQIVCPIWIVLQRNSNQQIPFFSCICLIIFYLKKQSTSTMHISDKWSIYFMDKNILTWKLANQYPDDCVPYMQYFAKEKRPSSSLS